MMMDSRVYGGSNMTLHGSSDALDALLISSSSPNFHGSRSMVNFQEINGKKSDGSFYQPHNYDETCDGDMSYCFYQPEKKKRLTVDQVQFLERCFEIENKLEPDRKIQIARDLDLQPRQVAIWFQNRRARWKTKQLEKDYETLKASYNNLKVGYENLLKEREKLKSEAIFLKERQSQKENSEKQITHLQFQKTEHGSVSAIEESETLIFKQEDLSCGNSAVFDSDGSHNKDCDRSSNIFEPDQSELSHTEEEEEHRVNRNQFPLVCNYGFTVEDQGLWF